MNFVNNFVNYYVVLIINQISRILTFGGLFDVVESKLETIYSTRCVTLSPFEWFSEVAAAIVTHSGAVIPTNIKCFKEQEIVINEVIHKYHFLEALIWLEIITLILILCINLHNWLKDPIGNRWSTLYISLCTFQMSNQQGTQTIRSHFNSCLDVNNVKANNHTHGQSAMVRNNGSSFMDLFSKLIARTAYFLQRSAADIRHERDGCRAFYWAKDLSVESGRYNPGENDILCLVDVDMYIDMPSLLTEQFQPVIISTFQPSSVCSSTKDYSYTFDNKSCVTYNVSGGASYNHKVWNYGADVVMVKTKSFGIHYIHIYNVDKRRLSEDHQLILLTPISRIITPYWNDSWLKGQKLCRLEVVETIINGDKTSDFLRMSMMTKNGLMRSTGLAGSYACANITAQMDDTLASMSRASKTIDLTIAMIKTVLKECDQATATILTEYHRCKTGKAPMVTYPITEAIHVYQSFAEADLHAPSSMHAFMNPLTLGAYAPTKSKANDISAINGRIKNVKPPSTLELDSKTLNYMDEFIKFLIPYPHVGHPVDQETVSIKQSKPSQQQILRRAEMIADSTDEQHVQTFQKAEIYQKLTPPRIICQVPGVCKLNYSCYIYSFTNVLRTTKWYAFAKTPIETAIRVASICYSALFCVMTDLSRFDGRVSTILRTLEKLAMLRYFSTEYHAELTELMSSQLNQTAHTTHGLKYATGTARLSGSPETADFNSMDNAFMAYFALRETTVNNIKMTAQQAWDKLGIYGGDDGITPDVNPETYIKVCEKVGQVLEIDLVKRGELGVTFLSRVYSPEVWFGDTDSMCDVFRTVSKLHTTHSLPANVTALQKLSEKLYSLYLTDKNTPIIGQYSSLLVEQFPHLVPSNADKNKFGLASYHSLCDEDVQYPNEDSSDGWMLDFVKKQIPDFNFDTFNCWLSIVKRTNDANLLLKPPICGNMSITHISKERVIVDGDIAEPKTININQTTEKTNIRKEYTSVDLAKMKLKPCNLFKDGKCKYADKCRYAHIKE